MKNKLLYFGALAVVAVGAYSLYMHPRPAVAKCPDDYATAEEQTVAVDAWTNDFFDAHPGASLSDWSAARHQYWVDNNCTAALERYEQAKAGKADPAAIERINTGIKGEMGG